MLGFNRWHLLRALAAILCIVGIVSLALAHFMPAPPSTIAIAMAYKGSAYERFALSYQKTLARSHITLNFRETDGASTSSIGGSTGRVARPPSIPSETNTTGNEWRRRLTEPPANPGWQIDDGSAIATRGT